MEQESLIEIKKSKISKYQTWLYISIFLLLSIFMIYSSHIHQNVLYSGDDIQFHLSRIEGLAENLLHQKWFPKINFFFLYGMGYASPLFYCELFLYPAAFFRLIGISVAQSYILYLILINFCTFLIAYFSFKKVDSVRWKAFLFAFLYGMSSYRLSDLTERAALGELLALMFLPVAFLGIYQIVKCERGQWIWLSVGMSGLILTHVLTGLIFSIFIVCYLLLNVESLKKRSEKLISLFKAAGLTIFLTSFFIFPLLEQVMNQRFMFQEKPVTYLSDNASTVLNYLGIAFRNNGYNNLGLFVIVALVFLGSMYKKLEQVNRQLILIAAGFAFLSTDFFPHKIFDQSIFNALQFPWRFFLVVTLCVCWVFASSCDQFFSGKMTIFRFVSGVIIGVCVLTAAHGVFLPEEQREVSYDRLENIQSNHLGWGQEYVPSKLQLSQVIAEPRKIRGQADIALTDVNWGYGEVQFDYETTKESSLVLPYLYYKGYHAVDRVQDREIRVNSSSTFPGLVEIQLNGRGKIHFFYKETAIQTVSLIVSIVVWISFVTWFVLMKRS